MKPSTFSMASPERLWRTPIWSPSHDLCFANISEQPYVGCGRFYPVKELSGCPDILWEQGYKYIIGKVYISDIFRPNSPAFNFLNFLCSRVNPNFSSSPLTAHSVVEHYCSDWTLLQKGRAQECRLAAPLPICRAVLILRPVKVLLLLSLCTLVQSPILSYLESHVLPEFLAFSTVYAVTGSLEINEYQHSR